MDRSTERLAYRPCLREIDMDCVHEYAITEAGQLVKRPRVRSRTVMPHGVRGGEVRKVFWDVTCVSARQH